jgi:hypothetical protein
MGPEITATVLARASSNLVDLNGHHMKCRTVNLCLLEPLVNPWYLFVHSSYQLFYVLVSIGLCRPSVTNRWQNVVCVCVRACDEQG